LQPKPHGNVAGFENSSDLHREGFTAFVALVDANAGALAAEIADAIGCCTATRADWAFRPNVLLYPSVGCILY
jgi:hypothetical protein